MAPALFMPSRGSVGFAREAVRGTAEILANATWVPIDIPPKWMPKVTYLPDKALRGSPVDVYDLILGNQYQEWDGKVSVYPDTFPIFAEAILGGLDTVTGAGPYTHDMPMKTTDGGATGELDGQPPSYTIFSFDGQSLRTVAGCMLQKLDISFAADGTLEADMTWLGASVVTTTTPPTTVFSAERMVPGWSACVTVVDSDADGVPGVIPQVTNLQSGSLSFDRGTGAVYTLCSRDPYAIWSGPLAVTGKITAAIDATDFVVRDGLEQFNTAWTFAFTEPDSGDVNTFYASKCQMSNPMIDQGKQWLSVDSDFTAVGNITDSGGVGWANARFEAINSVAAPYSDPA